MHEVAELGFGAFRSCPPGCEATKHSQIRRRARIGNVFEVVGLPRRRESLRWRPEIQVVATVVPINENRGKTNNISSTYRNKTRS